MIYIFYRFRNNSKIPELFYNLLLVNIIVFTFIKLKFNFCKKTIIPAGGSIKIYSYCNISIYPTESDILTGITLKLESILND